MRIGWTIDPGENAELMAGRDPAGEARPAAVSAGGHLLTASKSTPLGYSKITSISSAKGLADGSLGAIPDGATYAVIRPKTQGIAIRDDGTAPTASDGWPLEAGDTEIYDGDLSAWKCIELTSGAIVHVRFYKS